MTRTARRVALGSIVAISIAGISVVYLSFFAKHEIDVVGFPPLSYPGFQTWPTPRDFDGPGTVFGLEDGIFSFRGSLSENPELVGDESLSNIQTSQRWNVGLLDYFVSGSVGLGSSSSQDLQVIFKANGVQRWRLDPEKATQELANNMARFGKLPIFIVTEAISVRAIDLTITSKHDLEGDVKAGVNKTGHIELRQTRADNGDVLLKESYNRPYFIFYKTRKIAVLSGLNKTQILLVESGDTLRWSHERR